VENQSALSRKNDVIFSTDDATINAVSKLSTNCSETLIEVFDAVVKADAARVGRQGPAT